MERLPSGEIVHAGSDCYLKVIGEVSSLEIVRGAALSLADIGSRYIKHCQRQTTVCSSTNIFDSTVTISFRCTFFERLVIIPNVFANNVWRDMAFRRISLSKSARTGRTIYLLAPGHNIKASEAREYYEAILNTTDKPSHVPAFNFADDN